MEIFELFDRQGNKLNKQMERGSKIQNGEYHKVVHIWIKDSNGMYLVQQRNKSTDRYPYQWAPTAGAVLTGEEPIDAAIRETKEEIGVILDETELKHLKTMFVDHPKSSYIIDLFIVKKNIKPDGLIYDETEVKAVSLMNLKQIEYMMEHNQFWNFKRDVSEYDYLSILEERNE